MESMYRSPTAPVGVSGRGEGSARPGRAPGRSAGDDAVGIRAAVRGTLDDGGGGLRGMLRRLDRRYPDLSRRLGGRLDIEVPAILASMGVHLVLLLALATAGYAVAPRALREIQSRVVDTAIDAPLSHTSFQDLDMTADRPTNEPKVGSFAPDLAPSTVSAPAATAGASGTGPSPSGPVELARFDVRQATSAIAPTATMLGQSVAIRGEGSEHVGGVEGAVDRLADEILRRLEGGRTLVVWAFDASGSLVAERERLSRHIDAVYSHIAQLDEKQLSDDGGLLTAVVAFGRDRKAMTASPTADKDEIIAAINAVPIDETGFESTFQTVVEVVRRWGHYKDPSGRAYRPMVIVVTDEVGDDDKEYLEPAIEAASRAKVPVYVLGSQAIFGRAEGFMDYTDPKTGKTFRHVPVRQGPESAMLEQIRLPFWYGGQQYDLIDSGFGPYALSRLAGATGGIYFITRMSSNRMACDPAMMREYKPDWVGPKKYEAEVMASPVRRAVMEAALLTQQKLPGQPSLNFPAVEDNFKDALEKQQEVAARTAYTVDEALSVVAPAAKARDQEPSRRWQAHYDLIRGRLMAMKVRCYEYNWACATMKKDPPKFQKADSNAWKLVPDAEIHYSDKAAEAAKAARDLLEKVVDEHPGTPWALLAKRELKDPFGFKWVETHVKPVAQQKAEAEARAKMKKEANKGMARPAEMPKL
jgi:hypothetical protein